MLSLALGITLAELREMPAADLHRYRRFYRRQPFGPVRGDLNAWQIARNVGEMFGGRLRSPDRAVWGHAKKKARRQKDVKPETDSEAVRQFGKAMGIPITKGPDGGESVDR